MSKPLTLREALLQRMQAFAPEHERMRREELLPRPPADPNDQPDRAAHARRDSQ